MSRKKKAPEEPASASERLDREELKKIATALFGGQIFTTFHIRAGDARMASSIFMPILFMSPEDKEKLAARKPHVFFEYLDKASPRSINGYPIFSSMRVLGKEDWEEVVSISEKLKEAAKLL